MLAVRSHPPSLPQWRGRSPQVSHTARARQASEERRRTRVSNEKSDGPFHDVSPPPPMHNVLVTAPDPSPPTSSLAPDYYDSPPSPPRSLADQVHVAYALEDMHLAKVLLLRLKGINVTSPDDPRIAAVKDEDFDFCFVPHGRLMDEEDEKALKERQKMELERLEQRRREERLRDCERIWEQGKERLREAKALAVRRREEEQQRRRAEESRSLVSARRPRTPTAPPRSIVTYKLVSSSKRREEEPFVYDFMPHTPSRPLIKPQIPSRPKSKSPFSRSRFDDTRAVPFSDVLTSMQGPLFPHDRRPLSRHDRDVDLLDTLLRVVEWEDDERRRRKGKAPARPPLRRNGSEKSCVMCCESSSLASSSSSSSSLSPTPSRRSWLSFSSASSSTSTAATTPSSSPPTWFTKSASPTRKPRPKPWFLASSCTFSPLPHPCKPCSHLTPVSPADSPLPIAPMDPKYSHIQSCHRLTTPPSHTSPTHSADDAHAPTSPVLRRLSQFLDLAKGFQHAYMNATMFAVAASTDALDDRRHAAALLASFSARKHARSPHPHPHLHPLRPSGQRVRPVDVKAFLDSSSPHPDSETPTPSSPRPIPLRTRNTNEDGDGDDAADAEPPRTVLPDPLPYPIRFKPHSASPRSPFRVHAHLCGGGGGGEGEVVLRVRAVENPLYLRVLAAGNVAASRCWSGSVGMGMGIEGVVVHEGMLGSGREKVLQIACEGIGRSSLGVEVQVGSGAVGAGEDDVPWRFGEAAVRGRGGRQAWW